LETRSQDRDLVLTSTYIRSEKGHTGEEKEHPAQQADYVPVPEAGYYKEQCRECEENPSPQVVPFVFLWAVPGHVYLFADQNGYSSS
jgi:hypothetical protein